MDMSDPQILLTHLKHYTHSLQAAALKSFAHVHFYSHLCFCRQRYLLHISVTFYPGSFIFLRFIDGIFFLFFSFSNEVHIPVILSQS